MSRSLRRGLAAFLAELRRRHVVRVGVAYLAASWIMIEASDAVFPALGIPDWALSLVTVLLGLGFPLALVLTWIFDITPHGIQRTPALSDPPAADALPPFAIAALPFLDRSHEGGYQFLGDGISEELINGLARVEGLRVVARTSSFTFRGEGTDVREIGRTLGVGYLLEGSVQVAHDRLRLTARLVDAREGWTAWSATYDRAMADLLQVQEEVAVAVLAALAPRLEEVRSIPGGRGGLLPGFTSDVEAYTLYLRGRALWNVRTSDALHRAVPYFRDALTRDPRFAHAHAGLADTYGILADYGLIAPEEALTGGGEAARRAVELAPHLAEARTSQALMRQIRGDWTGAEAAFRSALEANPGYATARHRLALLLAWTGRLQEAREEIRAALAFDPLSPAIRASEGWIEYYGGEFRRAAELLKEVIQRHPELAAARVPLALALARLGCAEESLEHLRLARSAGDTAGSATALLAYRLDVMGRPEEAAAERQKLEKASRTRYVSPYYQAVALLGLQSVGEALDRLARAVDEGAPQVVHLGVDPIFDPLRELPRFRQLLQRIGLGGPSPKPLGPAPPAHRPLASS